MVTDGSGTLGVIPAPVVSDASGRLATAGTASMAVDPDGKHVITSVAQIWLTAMGLQFPVTVDPDFMGSASSNTTINGVNPTTAYGSSAALTVAGSPSGAQRVLLNFGDIGTSLPRDAEIDQAQVGLGVSVESGSPTVAVYPLTTNFAASSATWQKASSSTNWTTAGGDYTSTEGERPQVITGTDPSGAGSAQHTW